MTRFRAWSLGLVVASLPSTAHVQTATADLTSSLAVPAAALPEGCALAPSPSERVEGPSVRFGFWGGLPIRSNPWAGTESRPLVEIRTRMFGAPRMADAPPDARLAAQMQRQLVEGLSGYAAFYRQGQALVHVYALQSPEPLEWNRWSPADGVGTMGQAASRIKIGKVAVLMLGDSGPCFTAVAQHLRATRLQ
jgi:hypothetical protein